MPSWICAGRSTLDSDEPLLAAQTDYSNAFTMPDQLLSKHVSVWNALWASRIAVSGDQNLTAITNAGQYYLLSAARDDWPWSVSPGSLSSNGFGASML